MGTETSKICFSFVVSICKFVKLNNPLMGTETLSWLLPLYDDRLHYDVKLNNPLMGTETTSYQVAV